MREHPLLLWWWLHYHPVDPHPHQTCTLASHAHLPYPPVWPLSMIPSLTIPLLLVHPRINALTSFKFNGSPSPPSRYCPTNHHIHLRVIPIYMGRNCFHGSKHALSLATPKHTTLIGWSLSFSPPLPFVFFFFFLSWSQVWFQYCSSRIYLFATALDTVYSQPYSHVPTSFQYLRNIPYNIRALQHVNPGRRRQPG